MPYPVQISREGVISQARTMIESEGVERLSLGRLAEALGVTAPSLYRYFDGKSALLNAINLAMLSGLVETMRAAQQQVEHEGESATAVIAKMLWAYRAFALANRAAYVLAFTTLSGGDSAEAHQNAELIEALVLPLQAAVARVVGEVMSLQALRTAWALAHGFVMLEICGQFRRDGDLDTAYQTAIDLYVAGLNAGR